MIKRKFAIAAAVALACCLAGPAGAQSQMTDPSGAPEMPGMSLIPAGEFWMGRVHAWFYDQIGWSFRDYDDDRPSHSVQIDRFYIDKYEVTNEDYARFTSATGHRKPWHWPKGRFLEDTSRMPVYNVTWDDAAAYCAWAGKRLPTEAEWEKAARGGLDRKLYPWGDELEEKLGREAQYQEQSKQPKPAHYKSAFGPVAVGSFAPNGYDLYDMTGNVWEWTADWYERDYYAGSPRNNPKGPDVGVYRVVRGGGWSTSERPPRRSVLGVHYRNFARPSQLSNAFGFRCAKTAVPVQEAGR